MCNRIIKETYKEDKNLKHIQDGNNEGDNRKI